MDVLIRAWYDKPQVNTFSSREKQVLNGILSILRKELAPRRILLFGSRAKGRAHHGSDFDIAVDARTPRSAKKSSIAEKIDKIAGLYRVDVVFLRQVSKDFRNIVQKTGEVLYER